MTCRHAARVGQEADSKNKHTGSAPAARSVSPARGALGVARGGGCSCQQGSHVAAGHMQSPRGDRLKQLLAIPTNAWRCVCCELVDSSHWGPAGCEALEARRTLWTGTQAGPLVSGSVFHALHRITAHTLASDTTHLMSPFRSPCSKAPRGPAVSPEAQWRTACLCFAGLLVESPFLCLQEWGPCLTWAQWPEATLGS